jgi:hypothetical protein
MTQCYKYVWWSQVENLCLKVVELLKKPDMTLAKRKQQNVTKIFIDHCKMYVGYNFCMGRGKNGA